MKTRAVLYTRFSGEGLHHRSPIARGYVFVRGSFRPTASERSTRLVRDGPFEVLLCRELDRLAHLLEKQLYIEDEVMKRVVASVAEYERIKSPSAHAGPAQQRGGRERHLLRRTAVRTPRSHREWQARVEWP